MGQRRPAAVLAALGQGGRTPPGAESGAGSPRGHAGTWESPLSPCPPGPDWGSGCPQALACPGASAGSRAREGPHEGRTQARYRGGERQGKPPERGRGQAERRSVPVQVGQGGPSDPRAGRRPPGRAPAGWRQGRDRERTPPAPGRPGDGARAAAALRQRCGEALAMLRNRMRAWRPSGSVGGPAGSPSALPGKRRGTAAATQERRLFPAPEAQRSAHKQPERTVQSLVCKASWEYP